MHSPKKDPERWVQDHPSSGQEFDQEVGMKVTVWFAVGIVVVSVLTMIGMWMLLNQFVTPDGQHGLAQAPRVPQALPPEPRLQIHPEQELQAFLAEQNQHLESWGWVDQSQDRGHIAIEAAMQLIAERGLPVREHPRRWENPLVWRNPSLQYLHQEAMH